jgi:hypothetical protein
MLLSSCRDDREARDVPINSLYEDDHFQCDRSVIVDTVRGRRRKKDDIDRMLAIEWLFSERAERLQVAAQSDFLGS